MNHSNLQLDPALRSDPALAEAVEELTARLKAGDAVELDAWLAQRPMYADELRRLFPMLRLLAELSSSGAASPPAIPPDAVASGLLGDFRILREVGKGGMGIVYEAEQISLGRRVALKVLPLAATMDARHLQRFHNEARAAACLHHTNIVPVYYVGSERGVHFYAMQFIDGQPLSDVIHHLRGQEKKKTRATSNDPTAAYQPPQGAIATSPTVGPVGASTPLTSERRRGRDYYRKVAELGVQAAEALDHAHQLGIVHRDIKPANLLLDDRGDLWITDFGLAQMQSDTRLTQTGDLVGTLRYMSPEQALAKRVVIDHRTDIYSLGATLYELLTLEPAFGGEDRQELLRQIAFEEPAAPRRLHKSIPAELETIVLKAMEKNPAERYATAKEVADDLRSFLNDKPIRARRPTLIQRTRRWVRRHQAVVWSAAVCALLTMAVVGASIGWVTGDRAARRDKAADKFNEAVQQAIAFLQEENWPQARAAAQRAAGLLAGAGGDSEQQQRLEQVEADLKMGTDLELTRLVRSEIKDDDFDHANADFLYRTAFRTYNLPVLELEPEEAARRIVASNIREQLLAALVDWLRYCTDHPEQAKKLTALLRLADTNPWRQRLWDATDHDDHSKLLRLAQSEEALGQPPARLVALGDILAQVDKPAAVEFLRQAQQRHPDDFWINGLLADLISKMEPPLLEESIGFFRVAVGLRPKSPGALFCLGNALYAKGQLDQAIAQFREAIHLKKDYAFAHDNLGIALREKGQLDEAIAEHREAIRIKKALPNAHNHLGNALHAKGQLDQAIAEYREAIHLKKDYAIAHSNLGNTLREKGHLDEAIVEYREAIRIKKNYAEAHSNLGLALVHKRQLDEAIAECREAIRLKKDSAGTHNNLGIALKAKGQLDDALIEYREAIRLDKNFAPAHNNLGDTLATKGRLDEAIDEFRETIRLEKDFAGAHNNLGNALTAKRELDKAIDEYREAIRLKKDYAEAHKNLGNALKAKGELDKAINEFREAIRLNEKYAEAHCDLGQILLRQGKFQESVEELRRGHELGSKNPRWPYPSAQWLRLAERIADLDKRLPALVKGQEQPKDAGECLALARLCQEYRKQHAAAVRFYGEAFHLQKNLIDDRQGLHRYNAACSAALAGCGEGNDAPVEDPERARLRRRALEWLRDDLKTEGENLKSWWPGRAEEARKRLDHWMVDPDFNGVRGPHALAKLPEAERKDWQKLWAEVEEVRTKAQGKAPAAKIPDAK